MEAIHVMCGEYVDSKYSAHLAPLFASLSNSLNLRILLALGDDEVSVNHLADVLELPPQEVQRCLNDLEELNLVGGHLYGCVRLFHARERGLRNLIFGRARTLTNA